MSDDRPPGDLPARDLPDAVVEPLLGEEVPALDLSSVDFLSPGSPGTTPMPADVWQRLEATLAAEAARRGPVAASVAASVAAAGTAEPSSAPVIPITRARRSGPMRWAGGLVAAGVVVVGGAVVVPTMLAGTATVAGDSATSTLDASTRATSPQELTVAGGQPEAMPDAAAEMAPMAAVEPAAKVVLASNTVYTPKTLRSQVVDLVRQEGITSPEDAATYAAVTTDLPTLAGFTQTWDALRECLTRLAMPADATALLVDRGTYDGEPAGVIVAPDTGVDYAAAGESPAPTETVATASGLFDIWVVDEDCEQPTMTTLDNVLLFAR